MEKHCCVTYGIDFLYKCRQDPAAYIIISENCGDIQDFKGENWKDLFDVVVALAAKPNFYTSQRPFRLDIIHNSSFEGEFTLNMDVIKKVHDSSGDSE
jgi:hypothetical protein